MYYLIIECSNCETKSWETLVQGCEELSGSLCLEIVIDIIVSLENSDSIR